MLGTIASARYVDATSGWLCMVRQHWLYLLCCCLGYPVEKYVPTLLQDIELDELANMDEVREVRWVSRICG